MELEMSSCTTGVVAVVDAVIGINDEVVAGVVVEVVVEEVVVVMVGITKMVVIVDPVVAVASCVSVVVVAVGSPTTSVNMALFEKLKESPVHVPPVGLSRPYAYILYVPGVDGAVTVTENVAVRRSAERDGPRYTPLIQGALLTM
jgi:hypothetical protein